VLCISKDGDPDEGGAYAFPTGDEPPAVHASLEEYYEELRRGQGEGPAGLKLV